MIRLTKTGVVFDGASVEVATLRAEFDARHVARLPGFLDTSLLAIVQESLRRSPFERFDREIGNEQRPSDCSSTFALNTLLNSQRTLALFRRLTGCEEITCFGGGRIYRRLPEPDYHHLWHDDVTTGGRLVALSVNLSEAVFSGGALQLRDAATEQIICEEFNTGFGDAIIFRIDPRLQHRIAQVTGAHAKTAFAGWFKSKP